MCQAAGQFRVLLLRTFIVEQRRKCNGLIELCIIIVGILCVVTGALEREDVIRLRRHVTTNWNLHVC